MDKAALRKHRRKCARLRRAILDDFATGGTRTCSDLARSIRSASPNDISLALKELKRLRKIEQTKPGGFTWRIVVTMQDRIRDAVEEWFWDTNGGRLDDWTYVDRDARAKLTRTIMAVVRRDIPRQGAARA